MKRANDDDEQDHQRTGRPSHPGAQDESDDRKPESQPTYRTSSEEETRYKQVTERSSNPSTSNPSTSNPSTSNPSASGSEEAAAAASGSSDASNPPGGTYPQPSNFAERVMHVLENDIATEAIWWLPGSNGQVIALNPDTAKSSGFLAEHFNGNRFATFLRTLTRWGFKKVTHQNLPERIVTLRNGLFQRDQPHLVQFMMMDSDVQDVFDEHQKSLGTEQPASGIPEPAPAGPVQSQESLGGDGGGGGIPPSEQVDTGGSAARAQDTQDIQQQAASMMQGFVGQSQIQAFMANLAATTQNSVSSPSASSQQAPEDPSAGVLRELLRNAERYLGMTSADNPQNMAMRGLLQLLLVLGRTHLQFYMERRQQQQLSVGDAQSAQQFLFQLAQAVGQQLPQQPAQASSIAPPVIQQWADQSQQGGYAQQGQQQPLSQVAALGPQQGTDNPAMFASMLQQFIQGPGGQSQQQQQPSLPVAPANQWGANNVGAGGNAPAGVPLPQQLLQFLMQQQQQQQQQQPPPQPPPE